MLICTTETTQNMISLYTFLQNDTTVVQSFALSN